MDDLNRIICSEDVIPVIGGATLQVRGDFKLCCIGDTCEKYPCKVVEEYFEKKGGR